MRLRKPSGGQIPSGFGPRKLGYGSTFHRGVDFSWMRATDRVTDLRILAAADGTVSFRGASGGFGNLLIINHGGGYSTYYAHCAAFHVRHGQTVTVGQLIATMGHTGLPASYGVHLHFELHVNGKAIDPMPYFTSVAGGGTPITAPTIEENTMDMIHHTEKVVIKPGKAGQYEATMGDKNFYTVFTGTWWLPVDGSGALANSWARIVGHNSREVEKSDTVRIRAHIDSLPKSGGGTVVNGPTAAEVAAEVIRQMKLPGN